MAKKTPVKKSKRGLKRSVRRSLSAVLMITAIGVAAIPVPENYAVDSNGGIATYAAAADTHTVYSYNELKTGKSDADGSDISDSTISGLFTEDITGAWLEYYNSDKDDDKQTGASGAPLAIVESLKVVNNGTRDELTWEYKYYLANGQIVLCKYNSPYTQGTAVTLEYAPNIEYFKVPTTVFDEYFEYGFSTRTSGESSKFTTTNGRKYIKLSDTLTIEMTADPANDSVTYSYSDFENDCALMPEDTKYFFENFGSNWFESRTGLYAKYKSDYDDWKKAKDEYENANPGQSYSVEAPEKNWTTADETTKMRDALNSTKRIDFFCYYCKTLNDKGTGYTLKEVLDTTGTSSSAAETQKNAYIAYGGTPLTPDVDNVDGYMVTSKGNSVTAIGKKAFMDVGNVSNIVLPTTVHYIGDEAFYHCNSLTSIEIPNVKTIGNRAFQNCNNLARVIMKEGVETIGVESFKDCNSLTSVEFSPNTKKIGAGAFANCIGLTQLNLDRINENYIIDAAAFYNCTALTQVNMKDTGSGLLQIGDSAFAVADGDNMTEFTFPSTINDSDTNWNNTSIKGFIGDRIFSGRSSLTTVVFPSNYGRNREIKLPANMFHGCSKLAYVEFNTNKGSDSSACSNLGYEANMFADVNNKDFYVSGPKEKTTGAVASPRESTWYAVTRAYEEAGYVPYLYYENGVEYYEICSGDYLLCIRKNADGTGTLTSCTRRDPTQTPREGTLTIPDKVGDTVVVAIDTDCFSDTGLTATVKELIINDNIREIAASTFANTNGKWNRLQKVTIGSAVEKLGENAFYNCSSLTDVTFKTPVNNDYTKLQFPDSAFRTIMPGSEVIHGLTIHGDIVKGYRPYEYAVNPKTYLIDEPDGRRVCYQSRWDSPSSKHMTVMYGESGYSSKGLVTLLDYPKYSELEDTTSPTGADLAVHNREREQQFYESYAIETYDNKRIAFINGWLDAGTDNADDVYNAVDAESGDPLYGPWISEDFISNWSAWVERARPSAPDDSGDARGMFDWLFEPITAQAFEKSDVPSAYFDKYPFNFMTNYKKYHGDESQIPTFESTGATINYLGWNDFEKEIIRSVEDIVIPEGVESIDVYDYYNLNRSSFNLYLPGKSEYTSELDEDKERTVNPGLFSGLIKDYEGDDEGDDKKIYEARGVKGNDRIKSVTMSSVLYLPDYAFDNCERLETVILGDAMQQVGALPFRDCIRLVNLTGNAKYPADNGILYEVQAGEAEAYKIIECLLARGAGSPLSDMVVSDVFDSKIPFVSTIAKDAFSDCDNINTINLYPATLLTEILDGTFRDCDNLALVTLPASVNDIHDNAFADICKASTLNPRCQIYIYGSEVSISDNAFGKDSELPTFVGDKRAHAKERIKIWAYDNTAAARYAKYYSKDGNGNEDMLFEPIPASESAFSVIFMDYDGTQLGNTQFVINSTPEIPDTTELEKPDHRPGYRFTGWLGTNGQDISKKISDNCIFFAQYESDGTMVNGAYVVEFRDGIDGRQLNNMYANREDGKYYIAPGTSFMSNGWEVPPYYAHEGYDFLAWSNNWTENTVIDSNMTIIALYSANSAGGSGGSSGVVGGSSGTTQTPGTTSNKSSSNTSTSSSSTSTSSTTSGSSEVGKYTVTVENGSGSGSYDVGSTVIIAANTPPAGMVFKNWTTESNGVALASVSMTATTFTMPANNVTVTANYVAATPTVANTGSTGSVGNTGNTGNRDNGSTRVDITKPGISNKDLATANTNGSTDNFVVKITETDEATRAVAEALTNKYGSLENILYYAMDISLYDSTGTVKITNTTGLSVDITIPIPDALVAYGGNNMAGAVINGNQLENLNENFTTINGVPCIRFTATHFSPYTIYVDTGNLTEGMLDVTPKTGDPIHPKWFLSIGLACLSVILFMKKDKAVKVKTA